MTETFMEKLEELEARVFALERKGKRLFTNTK